MNVFEVLDESTVSLFREGKGGWEETWQSSAKPKRIRLQGPTFCLLLSSSLCVHGPSCSEREREGERERRGKRKRKEEKSL